MVPSYRKARSLDELEGHFNRCPRSFGLGNEPAAPETLASEAPETEADTPVNAPIETPKETPAAETTTEAAQETSSDETPMEQEVAPAADVCPQPPAAVADGSGEATPKDSAPEASERPNQIFMFNDRNRLFLQK